jgi:hypothetical protein
MKKNLLLSLAITLLFSISALAQIGTRSLTVTIESGEYVEGNIAVPVILEFNEDVTVGAFTLEIQIIDVVGTNVLGVLDATAGPGLPAGLTSPVAGTNPFTVSFANNPGINSSTLTTDDILIYLDFDASVGISSLTFIGTTAFYENEAGTDLITSTFNDGLITVSSAVPLSMWGFFLMAGLIIAFLAFRAVRLF